MTVCPMNHHHDGGDPKVSLVPSEVVETIVVDSNRDIENKVSKLVKYSTSSDLDCTTKCLLQITRLPMDFSLLQSLNENQNLTQNDNISQISINNTKCCSSNDEIASVSSFQREKKNSLFAKMLNGFNIPSTISYDAKTHQQQQSPLPSTVWDVSNDVAADSVNADQPRSNSLDNEHGCEDPIKSLHDIEGCPQKEQCLLDIQTCSEITNAEDRIPPCDIIALSESRLSDLHTSLSEANDNECIYAGSKRVLSPSTSLESFSSPPASKRCKTLIDSLDVSENALTMQQQSQVSIKFHEDYYMAINHVHDEIDNLIDEIESIDDILVMSDDDSDIGDDCDCVSETSSSIGCLYFNDYDVDNALLTSSTRRILQSHFPKREYKIRFTDCVDVVEIPHRHTYSVEEHQLMWTGSEQLQKNAERNSVEYEYERWNMESVIEENEFVISGDGQLIHPVHKTTTAADDDISLIDHLINIDDANESTDSEEHSSIVICVNSMQQVIEEERQSLMT